MAYPLGFNYVGGPAEYIWSDVSSTATFRERNPVTYSDDRTLIEATSDVTAIVGVAQNAAADSLAGRTGKVLVLIPTRDTVFATQVQTGVATSVTSAGQAYNLEKSGDFLRLDTDSQTTPVVQIVGDQYGTTVRSEDSSVFVKFLGNVLGGYGSNASVNIFAQT
jgi:hypothetical protein